MRIPSAKVDQRIYFVAVDSTDLKTRETGLASFTVYRSRNGGAATAYTTPTVAELSSGNMPGVYSLLIDEDTTIDSGSDSEEYCLHITHAGMAPVTRVIELYRRDTTSGQTSVTQTGDAYARLGAPAGASVSADIAAVKGDTSATLVDTNELQTDWANGGRLDNILDARASQTSVDTIDGIVDAILIDTAEIGAAGAGLTVLATAANLATVDTVVDAILADTGTDGVVVATASKTGYRLSATGVDDVLDEVVEGSTTLRQSVRLANSALGSKASGLEGTTAVFRDVGDTKNRISATVDADGNRSAVTLDLT